MFVQKFFPSESACYWRLQNDTHNLFATHNYKHLTSHVSRLGGFVYMDLSTLLHTTAALLSLPFERSTPIGRTIATNKTNLTRVFKTVELDRFQCGVNASIYVATNRNIPLDWYFWVAKNKYYDKKSMSNEKSFMQISRLIINLNTK